ATKQKLFMATSVSLCRAIIYNRCERHNGISHIVNGGAPRDTCGRRQVKRALQSNEHSASRRPDRKKIGPLSPLHLSTKQKQVRMFSRSMMCCALAVLAVGAAFAQTTTTTTRTLNFPPFGLGSSETARINLTNIATASSSGTAASCTGTASFVNATGATIGTATNFTIASGVTTSASLPFGSAAISTPRSSIRAVVTVSRSTSAPAPCALLISVETFDTSTGAGHLYIAGQEYADGGRDFGGGNRP